MERVLTIKANYLADILGYDVNIIITDDKGTRPYFPISDKIKVIQLDINIDNLWQYPLWKRLFLYHLKMKEYKRRLDICLRHLRPDITISLLRREINFLNDIKDGSAKVGEIHFGRYKYREANFSFLPNFANKWITNRWMAQLDKKVKELDRFVVLTHEDASYWNELKNIDIIPNPITISNGAFSDNTQKRAIAVGRYTYQKGFDLLIKAWQIVNKHHPDWELNIYGSGDNQSYSNLADSLGLKESVLCHGAVNNIRDEYINCSIFILSSRFEGFGLVLAEAMSVGLSSVAFACPCGPRDIIHNGKDGILCENGNIQELANGICRLIENENLRKQIGKNAAINIQRYKLDNIMEQWDRLFKELTREKNEKDMFCC